MFDIHNHILFGLDDGPSTLEESVNMARIAHADGIQFIVATPHNRDVHGRNLNYSLADAVNHLNQELLDLSVPISILLGMENHIEMDTLEQIHSGIALPIEGTNFILIELPFEFMPFYAEKVLGDLLRIGMTPIIVHPERNVPIHGDFLLLSGLVDMGCLVQTSAGSLMGDFGVLVQNVSRALIEQRLVHVIATDAHSDKGIRIPKISEAVALVSDIIGSSAASRMVLDIPLSIICDEDPDISNL
jgi:protein-tyrosine phosphatase